MLNFRAEAVESLKITLRHKTLKKYVVKKYVVKKYVVKKYVVLEEGLMPPQAGRRARRGQRKASWQASRQKHLCLRVELYS